MSKPNILLLASHAIAEFDDVRMFADLGYPIFCPGGYQDPRHGVEGMRPGIPQAPLYPDLIEACEAVRRDNGDPGDRIDWAKADLPREVLEWADVVICHHFPERWLVPQLREFAEFGVRAIWRTCGQSNPMLEAHMAGARRYEGPFEIVRYSPKERALPNFAGEDALIRFGKYPDDYGPWVGDGLFVTNVTQHMKQRGDACGYWFWQAATQGLTAIPLGPGSEEMNGPGAVGYDEPAFGHRGNPDIKLPMVSTVSKEWTEPDGTIRGEMNATFPNTMLDWLKHARAYLYTGTQPASYTLGLIEAMLTGVPVVSIGPRAFGGGGWVSDVFEGAEIASRGDDDPAAVHEWLELILQDRDYGNKVGAEQRWRAIELFDVRGVGKQWDELLCAS